MNEMQQIVELTGMQPVECACKTCVNMCRKAPCIGSPNDILKIIAAGHRDKLEATTWLAGIKYGIPPIEMVQLRFDTEKGSCVMLDNDGKCMLHESGLKPTEGKLADCRVTQVADGKCPPWLVVAAMWESPSQIQPIQIITLAMQK